jgi:enamine deaminase RidA (YjgF/YER057c/UK114 family)
LADNEFTNPATLAPTRGYSHVVSIPAGSRLVWTSGQVPFHADNTFGPDDWAGQTRLVMENVGEALKAGGASWDDLVKITIYVRDTSALDTVRSVRDEFLSKDHPPVATLVQVGLFREDILVEVEAVAAVAEG